MMIRCFMIPLLECFPFTDGSIPEGAPFWVGWFQCWCICRCIIERWLVCFAWIEPLPVFWQPNYHVSWHHSWKWGLFIIRILGLSVWSINEDTVDGIYYFMIWLSSYSPSYDSILLRYYVFCTYLDCNYCFASQILEIIQLEGHALSQEEASVMWRNIHLLQVFSSASLGDYSWENCMHAFPWILPVIHACAYSHNAPFTFENCSSLT